MKGPSLQRQLNCLKEHLNKEGTCIIVDETPYTICDCLYHTERHGDWELIIDEKMKNCDLKCKECKKCGLWDKKGYYFIPCSNIWRIRLD